MIYVLYAQNSCTCTNHEQPLVSDSWNFVYAPFESSLWIIDITISGPALFRTSATSIMIKGLPFCLGPGRGGIRTPDTVVRSHVLSSSELQAPPRGDLFPRVPSKRFPRLSSSGRTREQVSRKVLRFEVWSENDRMSNYVRDLEENKRPEAILASSYFSAGLPPQYRHRSKV